MIVRDPSVADLQEAPMYTEFAGTPRTSYFLLRDEWDLFAPSEFASDDVFDRATELGIEWNDLILEPQVFEEQLRRRIGNIDDHNAALEYLRHGGTLVKLPDEPGSVYYRLYVVGAIPEAARAPHWMQETD